MRSAGLMVMKLLFAGLTLLSAALVPAYVQAAEAPAAKPTIAKEADAVLTRVSDFYRVAKSARVEIRTEVVQAIPGMPAATHNITASLAVSRPNLLALKLTDSPEGEITLISDGKTVWTYLPALKQFTVDDAPKSLETLLRDHDLLTEITAMMGPITELFRDKPRENILVGVTLLVTASPETIEGVECERIRGEQEDMDWLAWFEAGEHPTLRKFAFSPLKGMLATAPADAKEKLKGAKLDVTVTYSNWQFDAELPASTFAFQPPDGAKKVAEFGPIGEEPAGGESADALKGKPAPDFSLDLLGGTKMQLASHKGKDVVILDFWATWCGPCVRALPILSEVAESFKDKGVVVYAVNQQEEAEVVKKFLEAKKLTLTTAMDAKGEAAKLYRVNGIPQTVIIDKEGNVASVHVGFSPGLKETLTKEIEKLLAK